MIKYPKNLNAFHLAVRKAVLAVKPTANESDIDLALSKALDFDDYKQLRKSLDSQPQWQIMRLNNDDIRVNDSVIKRDHYDTSTYELIEIENLKERLLKDYVNFSSNCYTENAERQRNQFNQTLIINVYDQLVRCDIDQRNFILISTSNGTDVIYPSEPKFNEILTVMLSDKSIAHD
ncbi:hypothetical protein [Photobacterium leiognathi]|uniref:hypothetical protein n=1 Tax=Photobacterium leiognathi TaxID=553611 RepID=UPI002982AD68|nr:hypothetical protein [Photobacterium leiognathi]